LQILSREGPASAGPSRVRLVAALVGVALLLGGCAVGGGDEEDELGGLPDDKAVSAQPLTVEPGAETTTTTVASGRAGGPTITVRGGTTTTASSRASGSGSGGTTTTTNAAGARPYATRANVVDRTGDTEGTSVQKSPAYGDLTRLHLEDDGIRARVTVEVAGNLPAQPGEGEHVAIGVDFLRDSGTESDYQLYARGNDEGWLAWLDTPSGLADYPGTFELGGNRLVFTVPWSALGGRRPGSLSMFAEWEQSRIAVVADESKDFAPDRGAQSFSF
jgi:hypothetical protein